MSQSSDISVKIDDEIDIENDIATDVTDVEKNIATDIKKIDKPHKGKPITMIEVSPKGTYLVNYSPKTFDKVNKDFFNLLNGSFIGWNVENVEDEFQLKLDYCHIITHEYKNMINICVSDNKKLAYIYDNYLIELKKEIFIRIKIIFGFIPHKPKIISGCVKEFTIYLKIMT
ncbi:hypothetical protein C1645_847204 [Glomus cerebriforme]|uniref:Uncharacterized protein n=1 Tax=Glomus cerebriforme TaxID=658196 RepID=A0A397S3B7_9GLOM|nr:hypothetical protein C1645_847204 [Glomus cerebriforme]